MGMLGLLKGSEIWGINARRALGAAIARSSSPVSTREHGNQRDRHADKCRQMVPDGFWAESR
jgi:hypothetical protein